MKNKIYELVNKEKEVIDNVKIKQTRNIISLDRSESYSV